MVTMNDGGEQQTIDACEAQHQKQQTTVDGSIAIPPPLNNKTSSSDVTATVAPIVEVPIIPKGYSLIRFPKEKSLFRKIMWFVLWPIHFLFMLTIPDCDRPRLRKLFPLTFIMCIVWIGSLSYMVAWMITIIGKCVCVTQFGEN